MLHRTYIRYLGVFLKRKLNMTNKGELLFEESDSDWDFPLLEKIWETVDDIGKNTLGFDYYDAQIEIISSEQMIDNYSTHALPQMYNHWSFGKSFVQNDNAYKTGQQGLAYEVVINTNPSIAYLMENNTATMQALVLAHASVGHSGFFKTNYLFTGWTDADSILGYLSFAKSYISQCEEKHGKLRVECLLDAAHALQLHGVDKYKKPLASVKKSDRQKLEREKHEEESFADIWRTASPVPKSKPSIFGEEDWGDWGAEQVNEKEENLLLYIETHSPSLEQWERNILGIVRKIAQYFYPQRQTSLMNEGFACMSHHTIMTEMFDRGNISAGSYLEFLTSHSGVVYQPGYDSKHYSGINIYALGYAMMRDIRRMCTSPDKEDMIWFPEICNTDWRETIQHVVANYRDESFVAQFLSPKIIRDFGLFTLDIDNDLSYHLVSATHDDDDVHSIRASLSGQYDLSKRVPQIEVSGFDKEGDRTLNIVHTVRDGVTLDYRSARNVVHHIYSLWGFPVNLEYRDENGVRVESI